MPIGIEIRSCKLGRGSAFGKSQEWEEGMDSEDSGESSG